MGRLASLSPIIYYPISIMEHHKHDVLDGSENSNRKELACFVIMIAIYDMHPLL